MLLSRVYCSIRTHIHPLFFTFFLIDIFFLTFCKKKKEKKLSLILWFNHFVLLNYGFFLYWTTMEKGFVYDAVKTVNKFPIFRSSEQTITWYIIRLSVSMSAIKGEEKKVFRLSLTRCEKKNGWHCNVYFDFDPVHKSRTETHTYDPKQPRKLWMERKKKHERNSKRQDNFDKITFLFDITMARTKRIIRP